MINKILTISNAVKLLVRKINQYYELRILIECIVIFQIKGYRRLFFFKSNFTFFSEKCSHRNLKSNELENNGF